MADDRDRREYERVDFHRSARVRPKESEKTQEVTLQDISLKGVLIECPRDRQPGTEEVEVIVELAAGNQAGDAPRIELVGSIVHREADSFGVTWNEIDADSMGHLRRLLELNLDYDEIQRELEELVSPDER